MEYNIYYILGALLVVYLLFGILNKKTARKRKSRRFMEGYERKDRKAGDESEEKKKRET